MFQEEEETTITLSIGGVEFCLTPSATDDDEDDYSADAANSMSISKICNGEVLINLNNFVGTLRVKNYNIGAALPTVNNAKKRAAHNHDTPSSEKKIRTNYSKDDKMKNAVEEWDTIKNQDIVPSKAAFARERDIHPHTFAVYVHDDPSKRRKIGSRTGKKSLVSDQNSELLAQYTPLAEGGDEDGHTASTVVGNLMQLQPQLSFEQARNYVQRTWRNNHGERLKKRSSGKASQKSTTANEQQSSCAASLVRHHLPDLPPLDHHYAPAADFDLNV